MKLRPMRIRWRPVSEKPDQPGVYLVWSPKLGARIDDIHPSWWNFRYRSKHPGARPAWMNGPRVAKWAYLWPHGHLRASGNKSEGGAT